MPVFESGLEVTGRSTDDAMARQGHRLRIACQRVHARQQDNLSLVRPWYCVFLRVPIPTRDHEDAVDVMLAEPRPSDHLCRSILMRLISFGATDGGWRLAEKRSDRASANGNDNRRRDP